MSPHLASGPGPSPTGSAPTSTYHPLRSASRARPVPRRPNPFAGRAEVAVGRWSRRSTAFFCAEAERRAAAAGLGPTLLTALAETRTREVRGVSIFERRVGSGPPTVVLHGGPGAHHDYLLPGFDALARGRELIYYDQRGGGRSAVSARHACRLAGASGRSRGAPARSGAWSS